MAFDDSILLYVAGFSTIALLSNICGYFTFPRADKCRALIFKKDRILLAILEIGSSIYSTVSIPSSRGFFSESSLSMVALFYFI